MPRLPRATAREVVRVLEGVGFIRVRGHGSHWVLRHRATKRRVTVPYHPSRVIPLGTMANILREAGLTSDDFERILRR